MTNRALDLDLLGLLDVGHQLRLLALPPTKRRRVLSKAGDRLAVYNRKRIRSQRNLDGSAFTPRQDGGRRKMLRGLAKGLKRLNTSSSQTVLGWRSRQLSRIAREHQFGHMQRMTVARMRRIGRSPSYNVPATRQQAKALLNAGYRIRDGKRWRRPAQSWIVQHLQYGQAGLILTRLEAATKKPHWAIRLPARHALGATPHSLRDMLKTVLQHTLNAPK